MTESTAARDGRGSSSTKLDAGVSNAHPSFALTANALPLADRWRSGQ
jgi:hypothetical protein